MEQIDKDGLAGAEPAIASGCDCRTGRILVRSSYFVRSLFNSSLGFIDLLSREPGLTSPDGEQYVRRINDSVRALSSLLEELTDMGRVEAGVEGVHFEQVDVRLLFSMLRERVHHLGMHLDVDCEKAVCLRADGVRLARTLLRLMTSLASEGIRDFKISVPEPADRMAGVLLAGSAAVDVSGRVAGARTEMTLEPTLNLELFRGWIEVMGGWVHQVTLRPLAFNVRFSLPVSENDD